MASAKLDYPCGYKTVLPLVLPDKLLMSAGPVNLSDRVRRAISLQSIPPACGPLYEVMDRIKVMLQYIFQTKNTLTLAIQASGNGANETVILNLVDPGETVLVAIGGVWGDKVVDMAKRRHANVVSIRAKLGEICTLKELEDAIIKHKPIVLFVTHGESTGGTLQPLEGLGDICHKYDCLLAVDAVVSLVVEPLFVDRWKLDVVTSAGQKAIGATAGVSVMTFSPRAEKVLFAKKEPAPYYFDIKRLGAYWNCFDERLFYHYTFSSNLLAGLHESLAIICEEGLSQVWDRHRAVSESFWKKLETIESRCFVQKKENRFHGVTIVELPEDIDSVEFVKHLEEKYSILVNFGDGPSPVTSVRVGFLGPNCTFELADYMIDSFAKTLKYLRSK